MGCFCKFISSFFRPLDACKSFPSLFEFFFPFLARAMSSLWNTLRERKRGFRHPRFCENSIRNALSERDLVLSPHYEFDGTHQSAVLSLAVDDLHSKYLLSGSMDGSISLFNIHFPSLGNDPLKILRTKPIHKIPRKNPRLASAFGHSRGITSIEWFPKDPDAFFTSSFDGSLLVWDTERMKPAFSFVLKSCIYSMTTPRQGLHSLVAVATDLPGNNIRLCDTARGSCVQSFPGHKEHPVCVKWSPQNEFHLASGGKEGDIFLWDMRLPNRSVFHFNHSLSSSVDSQVLSGGFDRTVNSMTFTKTGNHLLTLSLDRKLQLWNTASGLISPVAYPTIRTSSPRCLQMSLSSNGQYAIIPSERVVETVHISSGTHMGTSHGHLEAVNSIVSHPFFDEFYSAGNDCQILTWQYANFSSPDNMDQDSWSDYSEVGM